MRVLIATAGGEGRLRPSPGLATAIRAAGHGVTITSNDEYESLVVGCGLEFDASESLYARVMTGCLPQSMVSARQASGPVWGRPY